MLFPFLNRITRNFDQEVAKTIPGEIVHQNIYDAQWYVIGKPIDFSENRLTKVTVWSKDYVVWKEGRDQYNALQNACPHRGASFSDGSLHKSAPLSDGSLHKSAPLSDGSLHKSAPLSYGSLHKNCVVCPYHGYEYDGEGNLVNVPGIDLTHAYNMNQTRAQSFDVVEDGGWVYLNTFPYWEFNLTRGSLSNNLYSEPERLQGFNCVQLEMDYHADPRLLTENGLDISHIGFVHSFGNRDNPCPIDENPPKQVGPNRFSTTYNYAAGPDSLAKKIFGATLLQVQNEFVLPHTSISRIRFSPHNSSEYVNTIITFASPLSKNKTRLYVKNYRNFWQHGFGDAIIRDTMRKTMNEDRRIVEHIYDADKNGKFNMRYDKLSNTFRVLYEKLYRHIGKKN
jgi:phenylpropionate dioxygenase-like ring-hydroxylating dioxygenase large terminal subunit